MIKISYNQIFYKLADQKFDFIQFGIELTSVLVSVTMSNGVCTKSGKCYHVKDIAILILKTISMKFKFYLIYYKSITSFLKLLKKLN